MWLPWWFLGIPTPKMAEIGQNRSIFVRWIGKTIPKSKNNTEIKNFTPLLIFKGSINLFFRGLQHLKSPPSAFRRKHPTLIAYSSSKKKNQIPSLSEPK